MISRKELILSILSFGFVLQLQSQNIIKTLDNEVFKSKIGSMCEETTNTDACAGKGIYLILKFNKKKVAITEMYISSCDEESLSYKLEYNWELTYNNEIKIHYKPEDVKYKSIENMKFKMIDEVIFGYKKDWNNKLVEYKFDKSK